jgi:hypothetical protein
MPVVTVSLLGRLGNNLFSYAYARAYAERHGFEFQCDPWIGQKIFQINDTPVHEKNRAMARRTELDVRDGESNIEFRTYAQSQAAMIYTRTQARAWFRFREEHQYLMPPPDDLLAHHRVGDMQGYGYPQIRRASYLTACEKFGFDPKLLRFVTEEHPTDVPGLTKMGLGFLPDFYRLANARILFRANSSFSFWASIIGKAERVFSPVIRGLEGGREHDVNFIEGLWPRLADLDGVTDLHLPT